MKKKADEWRELVQDESMDEVGDKDDEQQQDNEGEDVGMELKEDASDDDDFMEDEGEEGIGVEQGVGGDDFMDGCYALDIDVHGIEGLI